MVNNLTMIVSAIMMSYSLDKPVLTNQVKDDGLYFCKNERTFENKTTPKPENCVYDSRFIFAIKEEELELKLNNPLVKEKDNHRNSLQRNYLLHKRNLLYNRTRNK